MLQPKVDAQHDHAASQAQHKAEDHSAVAAAHSYEGKAAEDNSANNNNKNTQKSAWEIEEEQKLKQYLENQYTKKNNLNS